MWILCNNYWKKLVYLKPHDSVQEPRVSKYGLKTFLCIFWNSSGVLQNELLETSPTVTPYVNYDKLTKVANKYCSNYEKTSENCGPLRLQDNALKHTTNQRKTVFLHEIVTLVATHCIAQTRPQTVCIHFIPYNTFQLKNF